jgi:signal transduction histidine kinase
MQKVTDNIVLLVLFAMTAVFILATAFVLFFLRYQRRALQQREELDHQATLLHSILQSQEEERRRIGRDLHDDVGAALSNLRLVLGSQTSVTDKETSTAYKPLIDNIIVTVRSISHSLMPPGLELFGLEYTLQELFDSFNLSGEFEVIFDNRAGKAIDELDKKTALALFRIIQELLSNTVKHANARKINLLVVNNNDTLSFTYSDDGKGMLMDPARKPGMGMQNIESRLSLIQGHSEVITAPGLGFTTIISIPFSQK